MVQLPHYIGAIPELGPINSPQNQDLTQPKSILEGVQNPSFEYKKLLFYYYNCVIFPIISKNYYQVLHV